MMQRQQLQPLYDAAAVGTVAQRRRASLLRRRQECLPQTILRLEQNTKMEISDHDGRDAKSNDK